MLNRKYRFSCLKVETTISQGPSSKNSGNLSLIMDDIICDQERRIHKFLEKEGVYLIDAKTAIEDLVRQNRPNISLELVMRA